MNKHTNEVTIMKYIKGQVYTDLHHSGAPCKVTAVKTGIKQARRIWDENQNVTGVWFLLGNSKKEEFVYFRS